MWKIFKMNIGGEPNNSLSATKTERDELCENIINSSAPKAGFYLLLVLSTFIVTVGLLKNSLILVIGGMLVAPLLSPILSISLAVTIFNFKVLWRSLKIFIVSAAVTLLIAYGLGLIADFSIMNISLLELLRVSDLTVFLIPVAAGAAASFAWAKKELNSSLPGVAVTVALLPPLAVAGLSLAVENFWIFKDALNVYLLNVLGIIIGSLIIFLLMGFRGSAKKIIKEVEEEEKSGQE
jgi:uncharacterized hydrophobic protein (TIGR00271 family)